MDTIYKLLYNLNDGVTLVIAILSAIGSIVSIIAFFVDNKVKKAKKIIACIVCVCILALMIFSKFLVKVPDVTGDLYVDARNELRECGLKYNIIKNEDQSIVRKQSVEGDTIVKKDTVIKLTLESDPEEKEESKEKLIDELKKKSVRFIDISFTFMDLKAQLMEEGGELRALVSNEIVNPNIKELRIVNEKYDMEFTDYSLISNNHPVYENSYVIKDVPVGDYWVEVEIDGYERFSKQIQIKSEMLAGTDLYNCSISLNKIDASALYPFSIRFVNSAYEDKNVSTYEISYDDGIPCVMQENVNRFSMKGRIGDKVFISVDNSMEKAEVHLAEPGEIFVMIKDDGTINQIDYLEWLNGVSR